MALNEHLRHANHLSLPVPASTAAGTPVRVGVLNGVTQTARGAGGNTPEQATVWLDGSHHLPVKGAVAAIGTPIYIKAGVLSGTAAGADALFGAALATQAGDGTIPVKIIQAGPAAGA